MSRFFVHSQFELVDSYLFLVLVVKMSGGAHAPHGAKWSPERIDVYKINTILQYKGCRTLQIETHYCLIHAGS